MAVHGLRPFAFGFLGQLVMIVVGAAALIAILKALKVYR
jgi:hypothetical protein